MYIYIYIAEESVNNTNNYYIYKKNILVFFIFDIFIVSGVNHSFKNQIKSVGSTGSTENWLLTRCNSYKKIQLHF